jgi:hypothetical protein
MLKRTSRMVRVTAVIAGAVAFGGPLAGSAVAASNDTPAESGTGALGSDGLAGEASSPSISRAEMTSWRMPAAHRDVDCHHDDAHGDDGDCKDESDDKDKGLNVFTHPFTDPYSGPFGGPHADDRYDDAWYCGGDGRSNGDDAHHYGGGDDDGYSYQYGKHHRDTFDYNHPKSCH